MDHENAGEENNIEVIYEDDDILVVHKPEGLMVHGDGRSTESTLADWLLEQYPDMKDVGEPWEDADGKRIVRPGIVHRLDRDTSGVMVVAKTSESYEHLKGQFKERRVEKTYHTVVYGNIKEDEGLIDKPIGKSNKDFRRFSAQPKARGTMRDAVTEYRVIGRAADKSACYLEVRPKTGRTHQIRVHMKAIHHPVVCDPLYAEGRECLFGLKRLALHAFALTFVTPSGEEETFTAPLPPEFERVQKECTQNTTERLQGDQ